MKTVTLNDFFAEECKKIEKSYTKSKNDVFGVESSIHISNIHLIVEKGTVYVVKGLDPDDPDRISDCIMVTDLIYNPPEDQENERD